MVCVTWALERKVHLGIYMIEVDELTIAGYHSSAVQIDINSVGQRSFAVRIHYEPVGPQH